MTCGIAAASNTTWHAPRQAGEFDHLRRKAEERMDAGIVVPLGSFAMVALIVAIVSLVRVRDREVEAHHRLHVEEMEHRRKMEELEIELQRTRQRS